MLLLAVKYRKCAVLGNEEPEVRWNLCWCVKWCFLCLLTKYIIDGAKVVVPADLNAINTYSPAALKAYQVLNCLGMSRVDVFLTEDNQVIYQRN